MGKAARQRNDVRSGLTADDHRLLRLLVECANDEMIARRMIVSVRTVRRRIARILDLLDADNRFAAGVAAASLGLIIQVPEGSDSHSERPSAFRGR